MTSRRIDPHRPAWHLAPTYGLLNDPNGFIQHGGRYHLFYQWNPEACAHGPKSWAHVTSPDLLHWRAEPLALTPTEPYERSGCYSGSAIAAQNKLNLIYTGNVKFDDGSRTAYQCLAIEAPDGGFVKLGPVLDLPAGYTGHVRDPKVWREPDAWYMVLGAQRANREGCVLLYRSTDLRHWTGAVEIAGSHLGGLGSFGYMWECPDLFALEGRHVLLACPQGLTPQADRYLNKFQCGWFAGSFDAAKMSFHHGAFHELDAGFEFYAPQTTLDSQGRRLIFGWLGLPDENESTQPTIAHGWIHQMSSPRELFWRDDRLCQRPVAELEALKGPLTRFEGMASSAPELDATAAWVDLRLEGHGQLELGDAARVEWGAGTLRLLRQNWRTRDWEARQTNIFRGQLRLLLDRSSIEAFLDDGESVLSARYFPSPGARMRLTGSHSLRLHHWPMQSTVNHVE